MNQLPLPPQSERRALAIAQAVYEAFGDYHARFSEITARAKQRFEMRDWSGARERRSRMGDGRSGHGIEPAAPYRLHRWMP